MPGARQDRLSWTEFVKKKDYILAHRNEFNLSNDDLYMMLALLVANCSPDPSTQVGAVVVSDNGNFITFGYNKGCIDDDVLEWDTDNKDPFVYHAEVIALRNHLMIHPNSVKTLYVTFSPCLACLRMCALYGVKKIIYHIPYTHTNLDAQEKITNYNDIVIEEYNPCCKSDDEEKSFSINNFLTEKGCSVKEVKKYQRGTMRCLQENN